MNKRTIVKSILSLGIVLMLLHISAVAVFADAPENGRSPETAFNIGSNWVSLKQNLSESTAIRPNESADNPTYFILEGDAVFDEENYRDYAGSLNIGEADLERHIVLDLNGHTIDRGLKDAENDGCVFKIYSGSSLTITDSSDNPETPAYDGKGVITGGNTTSGGGGVSVSDNAVFTLLGGSIKGNKAAGDKPLGGGVYIDGGRFYMYDGEIIENTVLSNKTDGTIAGGGGVYCRGTFTVSAGSIFNNTAFNTDNDSGMTDYHEYGGGVFVADHSEFTMDGGAVQNNTSCCGGGVSVIGADAEFIMNDGLVLENTASAIQRERSGSGGGVFIDNGSLSMNGGKITENLANGQLCTMDWPDKGKGGGVYAVRDNNDRSSIFVSGDAYIALNFRYESETSKKEENVITMVDRDFPDDDDSGLFFTITDKLTDGAYIGSYRAYSIVAIPGEGYTFADNDAGDSDAKKFFYDIDERAGGKYYGDSGKIKLEYGKKLKKDGVTLAKNSVNYTGEAIVPSLTVKYENPSTHEITTLNKDTDYRVSYRRNEDKAYVSEMKYSGEYTVVVSGAYDYFGRVEIPFNIGGNNYTPSVIKKEPVGKKGLQYRGYAQMLVDKGEAKNGVIYYAVTKKGEAAPAASSYSANIPKKTEAGDYTVWYKSKGLFLFSDSDVGAVDVSIAEHRHDLRHVERMEATDTEYGVKEHWFCQDDFCGRYFLDKDATIEVDGTYILLNPKNHVHFLDHHTRVEPTVSRTGTIEYWECKNCLKVFSDEACENEIMRKEITIPKKDKGDEPEETEDGHVHSLIHHEAVESTEEKEGNIEYWECSSCHKFFSDSEGKNEISADAVKIAKKTASQVEEEKIKKAEKAKNEGKGAATDTVVIKKAGKTIALTFEGTPSQNSVITVAKGNKFKINGEFKGFKSDSKAVKVTKKGKVTAKKATLNTPANITFTGANDGITYTLTVHVLDPADKSAVDVISGNSIKVKKTTINASASDIIIDLSLKGVPLNAEINKITDKKKATEALTGNNSIIVIGGDGFYHLRAKLLKKGKVKIPFKVNGKKFGYTLKIKK